MLNSAPIICHEIQLKNFRCFESTVISFSHPIVLLEGLNGAGKTSLLEALYYACYLRSFRTHIPKELVRLGQDHFFVRVKVKHEDNDSTIQVGFSSLKRSVKIDKKAISSYKELMEHYCVVSLIEDDMHIIKGNPQERRSFIDQVLMLIDPPFMTQMRELRKIITSRNYLLQHLNKPDDNYLLWTRQLWEKSRAIQQKRTEALAHLIEEVNGLVNTYFDGRSTITGDYQPKIMKDDVSFDQFMSRNRTLFESERAMGHSLFGAHLDDFVIQFESKSARRLASRGQQKLVITLLKMAQVRFITRHKGPLLFLIDDFITDFDSATLQRLFPIIQHLQCQLVITTPTAQGPISTSLQELGADRVCLSI